MPPPRRRVRSARGRQWRGCCPDAVRIWRITDMHGEGAPSLTDNLWAHAAVVLSGAAGRLYQRARAHRSDVHGLLRHCETWFTVGGRDTRADSRVKLRRRASVGAAACTCRRESARPVTCRFRRLRLSGRQSLAMLDERFPDDRATFRCRPRPGSSSAASIARRMRGSQKRRMWSATPVDRFFAGPASNRKNRRCGLPCRSGSAVSMLASFTRGRVGHLALLQQFELLRVEARILLLPFRRLLDRHHLHRGHLVLGAVGRPVGVVGRDRRSRPIPGSGTSCRRRPAACARVIIARSTVSPARLSMPTQSPSLMPRSSASCGWISSRSSLVPARRSPCGASARRRCTARGCGPVVRISGILAR